LKRKKRKNNKAFQHEENQPRGAKILNNTPQGEGGGCAAKGPCVRTGDGAKCPDKKGRKRGGKKGGSIHGGKKLFHLSRRSKLWQRNRKGKPRVCGCHLWEWRGKFKRKGKKGEKTPTYWEKKLARSLRKNSWGGSLVRGGPSRHKRKVNKKGVEWGGQEEAPWSKAFRHSIQFQVGGEKGVPTKGESEKPRPNNLGGRALIPPPQPKNRYWGKDEKRRARGETEKKRGGNICWGGVLMGPGVEARDFLSLGLGGEIFLRPI